MPKEYDVIVIGAGIGGLVCGCYLAKAGKKVLIAEKKSNTGGCCTSFKRNGYIFDAFAHSIGGLSNTGDLTLILNELDLSSKLIVDHRDPSDIIICPDYRISLWSDRERTSQELQNNFPNERFAIQKFIDLLKLPNHVLHFKLNKLTFGSLLESFFTSEQLKAILSIPVLGNAGLPASRISAFVALRLYQEFILDGGYYPLGGMQSMADLLAMEFQRLGGTLLLSSPITKILLYDGGVAGVKVKQDSIIHSEIIVANCDVSYVFSQLLSEQNLKKITICDEMKPSLSMFIIYSGLDANIAEISQDMRSTVWVFFSYDIEKIYHGIENNNLLENIEWFLFHGSPDGRGFTIATLASFQNKEYWERNKSRFYDSLLSKIETLMPGISGHIRLKVITTPETIYNWTSNYRGAVYGWEKSSEQFLVPYLSKFSAISGLYLSGHWTTSSFGISGVAHNGRTTARRILLRLDNAKR